MTMGMASQDIVTSRRLQIAIRAKNAPNLAFRFLSHEIDLAWLREAFKRTVAAGVLSPAAQEQLSSYRANLEDNLGRLLDRARSRGYAAPAQDCLVGLKVLEDLVLQRAVAMMLECVYSQDFLDVSFGYRPERPVSLALTRLNKRLRVLRSGCLLEVYIRDLVDTPDHKHLREVLRKRVTDRVILRLVGKWLRGQSLDDGNLRYADFGATSGSVIGPLVTDIYLHEVLDRWFEDRVRPRLAGRGFHLRYANTVVFALSNRSDAERILNALPRRLGQFGVAMERRRKLISFKVSHRTT